MSWIQTYSGKKFSFVDPQPEDITIIDIVNHLGKMCRFNGATKVFYSVAQHSIHVSQLCSTEAIVNSCLEYDGLMHDSGEAYYGDITTPLKILLEQYIGDQWDTITEHIDRVIANTFEFSYPTPSIVKMTDKISLATERRDIMLPVPFNWIVNLPYPHPDKIIPLPPEQAITAFYERYLRFRRH